MSGLGEYLEALKLQMGAFKEGTTQLATQMAVNDATRKIQDLHAQQLDEKQRLMANQQIGQELALRLTSAGASPGQISQATEGLVPSASGQAALIGQKEMQDSSQAFQSKEKALDRNLQRELFGLKAEAKGKERVNKISDTLYKQAQGDFDKSSKKTLDSLNQIQLAKEALASNNPIGDKSVVNFMARASGEVGALTEADKAPFGGSRSLDARISQTMSDLSSGKLTPENRKFINQLLVTFESAQQKNLERTRQTVAQRMANRARLQKLDMNEENFMQVLGGTSKSAEQNSTTTSNAQDQQALMWLNDPKSSSHPNFNKIREHYIRKGLLKP